MQEKITSLETQLYNNLVQSLIDYVQPIQLNAQLIAKLDCLFSFAHVSQRQNYIKPNISQGHELKISNGRHPVIEQQLPLGEENTSPMMYT